MSALTFILGAFLGLVILVAVPAVTEALARVRRARGRWGDRVRVHPAAIDDGPYRAGSTVERAPRPTPLSVWVTALVGPVWGSVMLVAIAPMLGIFGLTAGFCAEWMDSPPCEVPAALHLGLLIGGVALAAAGLVLGVLLLRDAITLPTAGAAELRGCRLTARAVTAHHASGLVCLGIGAAAHGASDGLLLMAIACVPGVLIGLVHWRACRPVARSLASARTEDAEAAGGQAQ